MVHKSQIRKSANLQIRKLLKYANLRICDVWNLFADRPPLLFWLNKINYVLVPLRQPQKSEQDSLPKSALAKVSAGQAPWLVGQPADSDSISDQWSKVQKITIFRKDLNQNPDQSPDICSKSSNDHNFSRKKKI